jgi:hypothetical protein
MNDYILNTVGISHYDKQQNWSSQQAQSLVKIG